MSLSNKAARLAMACKFKRQGYLDFRVCKSCDCAATGYEFVASVQKVNPDICPECKQDAFRRPWPLPQPTKKA